MRVDFNCFAGEWPFYRTRINTFEKLRELHLKNEISGGYISSLKAMFYNDPYEADKLLAEELRGFGEYKHVMTVNPLLPGSVYNIRRGAAELNVAGVRVVPAFHEFSLLSPEMDALCNSLNELNLPLFMTVRAHDNRQAYLMPQLGGALKELPEFISRRAELTILLCGIQLRELSGIKNEILAHGRVFADTCGLRTGAPVEDIKRAGLLGNMVFGSFAPVYTLESTLFSILEDDEESDEIKDLLSGKCFFNSRG